MVLVVVGVVVVVVVDEFWSRNRLRHHQTCRMSARLK